MSAVRRIHHINFIFRDLDAAIARFQTLFDIGTFAIDSLPERGVRTARARVGETWLVLVAPTRDDSVPGQYLAQHGEGFFLLSFGVSDLGDSIAAMEARLGCDAIGERREGLTGWQIADVDASASFGIQFQLTQDADSSIDEGDSDP